MHVARYDLADEARSAIDNDVELVFGHFFLLRL
jgi:hypothetical protein